MKAYFAHADGTMTTREVATPEAVMRLPVQSHLDPVMVYDDNSPPDVVPAVEMHVKIFKRMGIDQKIPCAYYIEAVNNDKTVGTILGMVACFKAAHPVTENIEHCMAEWSADHPPHMDEDMWAYMERAYEAVLESISNVAKMAPPPDPILGIVGPNVFSTQALPWQFATQTNVPYGHVFAPATGQQADFVMPKVARPPTPKIVKPKLPPVTPMPKGRMIQKRRD